MVTGGLAVEDDRNKLVAELVVSDLANQGIVVTSAFVIKVMALNRYVNNIIDVHLRGK